MIESLKSYIFDILIIDIFIILINLRVVGFFADYAKLVYIYPDKISPLNTAVDFPLDNVAASAFQDLKEELARVSMQAIQEDVPFVVETDASDKAVSGTLNQNGKPVAFFSKTLTETEKRMHSVEKEALAILLSV